MMPELILKGNNYLGLWKRSEGYWVITDDGSGVCNSIEEMSAYYNHGDEIGLVKEIISKGNDVIFEDHGESYGKGTYTYEEYLAQFKDKDAKEYIIYPYVTFTSYEAAKEIWDLLDK